MLLKENNPWLGLESYSVDDAYRFCGRDHDIEVVSNAIYDNFITTIYGISGAGKTSLLNAGLTPALKAKNYLPIRVRLQHNVSMSYSMQIINSVIAAVDSVDGEIEYDGELSLETVADNEKLWFFIHTRSFWTKDNYPMRPVIFIDQFEEIFTQNEECSKISAFFDLINSIQYDTPPANTKLLLEENTGYFDLRDNTSRIVFIIREDFLARLEDHSYGIAALRRNRIGIKQMNGHQALEVILNPSSKLIDRKGAIAVLSKVSGIEVVDSDRSLERVTIDTSILSLFCSELYQKAVDERCDTISSTIIEEFGSNIIAQFYSRNMAKVSSALVEYLEKHLLTFSGFRNSVALEDIEITKLSKEEINRNLMILTEKRILRIEDTSGVPRVEFTHDVLCKVAKHHRESKKQQQLNKRNRWLSIIKGTDFLFILFLLSIPFLSSWKSYLFTDIPILIAQVLLFAHIYVEKLNKQCNSCRFVSLVLFSLLFLPDLYVWSNMNYFAGSYFRSVVKIVSVFSSIILGSFAFVIPNRIQKQITTVLMVLNVLMFLYRYNLDVLYYLPLFSLLILTPIRYTNNKKAYIISIMASVLLMISCAYGGCWFAELVFLYPLTIFFIRPKDNSKTMKTSLISCLTLDVYKDHKHLKKMLLVAGLILTFVYSIYIGVSFGTNYKILSVPVASALVFILSTELCREISGKFREFIKDKSSNSIFKGTVMAALVSLMIFLCKFLPYGAIIILLIWIIVSVRLIIACKNKLDVCRQNVLHLVAIVFVSVFLVPINCLGYNIFSHIQYGVSFNEIKNGGSDLIVITDLQGNYGVRDRYNIVVPVKYAEITSVASYNIDDNIAVCRGFSSYAYFTKNFTMGSFYKWPTYYHRILSRIFGSTKNVTISSGETNKVPDIVFKMKEQDGSYVTWECSKHMNENNLCNDLIRLSAEYKFLNNKSSNLGAYEYLKLLKSTNENDSDLAKKVILNSFGKYLSYMTDIDSLPQLRKILDEQYLSQSTKQNLRLAFNKSYQLFPFVNDPQYIGFILDSLLVYTEPQSSKSYDVWEYYNNISRYCIFGKMFDKAEEYAKKAIQADSLLKYAYLNVIESNIARGRFDEAEKILDLYKNDMFYQGKIYREITEEEERIIHEENDSCSTLIRYNSLINSLRKDLEIFETCGIISGIDTLKYLEFKKNIINTEIPIYDSAEDMGGYYLCRKYESYLDVDGERYRNAYYDDYTLAENIITYQFYMVDGHQVSPCFKHFSKILDDDILLVIDEEDYKRKYIDMTKGTPCTIPGAFDHAWRFSEGKAAVSINGRLGFINSSGEYVIDTMFVYSNKSKSGLDQYNRQRKGFVDFIFRNGLCIMTGSNGKYGLIDDNGNWVLEAEYENIKYIDPCQVWLVMKTGQGGDENIMNYGAVNSEGRIIVVADKTKFMLIDGGKACWGDKNNEYVVVSDKSQTVSSGYSIEKTGNNEWCLIHPDGVKVTLYSWEIHLENPGACY